MGTPKQNEVIFFVRITDPDRQEVLMVDCADLAEALLVQRSYRGATLQGWLIDPTSLPTRAKKWRK